MLFVLLNLCLVVYFLFCCVVEENSNFFIIWNTVVKMTKLKIASASSSASLITIKNWLARANNIIIQTNDENVCCVSS